MMMQKQMRNNNKSQQQQQQRGSNNDNNNWTTTTTTTTKVLTVVLQIFVLLMVFVGDNNNNTGGVVGGAFGLTMDFSIVTTLCKKSLPDPKTGSWTGLPHVREKKTCCATPYKLSLQTSVSHYFASNDINYMVK